MQDTEQTKRWSGYSVFLHLALVVLAVQVVYLMRQNQALMQRGEPPRLAAGEVFQPMEVQSLDGQPSVLEFAATPEETVLFVFTTTCPVCQENQDVWKDLYTRFDAHYDIVGISVDETVATQNYVADNGLPFPVFIPTQPGTFPSTYKISSVPQTIVVDRDGEVKHMWTGTLPRSSFDQLAPASVAASHTP